MNETEALLLITNISKLETTKPRKDDLPTVKYRFKRVLEMFKYITLLQYPLHVSTDSCTLKSTCFS